MSELATRLSQVAAHQTLRLTHYGRKSGKPYEVTIWFVAVADAIYLVTGDLRRQWPRNVRVRPRVQMRIGAQTFSGEATGVTEPDERERVVDMLTAKYWMYSPMIRLGQFLRALGLVTDHTGAFRVHLDDPSAASP